MDKARAEAAIRAIKQALAWGHITPDEAKRRIKAIKDRMRW